MATLIQNELRVKACEDINNMLNEVQTINTAILDGEKTQFGISWGRRRSIDLDRAYSNKLLAMIKHQRQKRIKEINALAARHGVMLDEHDLYSISEEAIIRPIAIETENIAAEAPSELPEE